MSLNDVLEKIMEEKYYFPIEYVPEPTYLQTYQKRLQKMSKIHTFKTITYKIFLSGIQNMGPNKDLIGVVTMRLKKDRSYLCGSHSNT